jgi:hypothetical protein
MIGVIVDNSLKPVVLEFFELFKTPWEFYKDGETYEILLVNGNADYDPRAKLVLIYGSEKNRFDEEFGLTIADRVESLEMSYGDKTFPVYGAAVSFETGRTPLLKINGTQGSAAVSIETDHAAYVRVGYDLLQEIRHLLSVGQPEACALVPTLDLHIAFLRDRILDSGLPFVEIPPRPAGHPFIACLTHDVDFAGMRFHKFDHTMFGFIYRALFVSAVKALTGELPGRKLLKNVQAALSIPFVYAGMAKDFLVNFERYIQLEEGISSTFFFIPYRDTPGRIAGKPAPRIRAAKYGVADIRNELERLISAGRELGLHGIDAWEDPERGRQERNTIADCSGDQEVGVRMHWLYFSEDTPRCLEQAGFLYDSSVGYNNAVGYRAGTTQAFRPLGVEKLLELPLHIMDTALFYPQRMGLTEEEAFRLVRKIIADAVENGGALTINWHQRSIGPERFWDDFYLRLLGEMRAVNGYFCTARRAVKWFSKRRTATFHRVRATASRIDVKLTSPYEEGAPMLVLRAYGPVPKAMKRDQDRASRYTVVPFTGCLDATIPFHG